MTNNNIIDIPKVDKITTERIDKLCNLTLVNEDTLDFEKCKKYIEEHIDDNITFCGDRSSIRSIVQKRIAKYIKECPSLVQLFSFKSDNNFQRFRNDFHGYYYSYYYIKQGLRSPFVYPIEFDYVFDAIQEAIDFYVLYEQFSLKLEEDAIKRATEEATVASQKAVSDAKLAAKNAEDAANEAANKAVDSVIMQVVEKKRLEEKITKSVDEQMNRVTSKMSETSVTILGIFASIVLTVVGTFIYSASVLDNIKESNIYKLICVSALIGLICINITIIMFCFINKLGKNTDMTPLTTVTIVSINFILVLVMITSIVAYFKFPDNINNTNGDGQLSVELNVNSSIDNTDNLPAEPALTSLDFETQILPEP